MLDDLRYAVRNLRKSPVFTLVAVLSLALGIGANTAIFTLLDQVLLRMLPVKNPQELVRVYGAKGAFSGSSRCPSDCLSYPMYKDLRDQNQVFTGMLARWPVALSFTDGEKTERVRGELVSGNYFDVLGVKPAIGRTFTQDDDRVVNGHPLVILTYGFWRTRYAGDQSVLNRTVRVNGQSMTVVGVTQPGFQGVEVGRALDVMVPMMMKPQMTPTWNDLDNRRSIWMSSIGRLKPGVSRAQAEAAMQVIWKPLLEMEVKLVPNVGETFRQRYVSKKLVVEDVSKGQSELRQKFSTPLVVLMAMVGFVLLIACANVANLLLARAAARQKEIAVRLALGASRGRVIRQLLVESTVLAMLGGVAGLLVAASTGNILLRFLPQGGADQALTTSPDFRVLAFAFALSLMTGILFGLAPAWQATRPAIAPTLKDQASNVSAGGGQARLRMALVASQVALSLVLLVGAGLFARSVYNLQAVDPGFKTSNLMSFSIDASLNGYTQPRMKELFVRLEDSLLQLPGVVAATEVEIAPLSGNDASSSVRIDGYTPKPDENMNPMVNWVGPGYFAAMGIPLISGREITRRDGMDAPKVALINQTMAKYFFGNENPIGRHLGFGQGGPAAYEIVGVVRDGKYDNLREQTLRTLYVAVAQHSSVQNMTYYVRGSAKPEAMTSEMRAAVARLDPNLPVYDVQSVEEGINDSIYIDRMIAALSSFFGGLATLLAAIGLYGVMAYNVTRRTREIGVRMALGANRGNVVWLVMKEVAVLAGVGIGVALPVAYGLGRLVNSQLYGVAPADFAVLLGGAALLAMVAALAGYFPALRATRVDPLVALRYE
ncbi:MAG TPA: ABC transporter permease [Bryobacteraceae bacterium]|nr:ABC transporter permease [Bryobacteraceae bacterium]